MRALSGSIALIVLNAALVCAQSVEGTVRDAQGRTVASATVTLESKDTGVKLTTASNEQGGFRFATLRAGSYALRAQTGAGEAAAPIFALASGETKKIELTLEAAFFDEPKFIVAGVTDAMNRGGHGSDVVLRSAEALSAATASLMNGPAGAHAATEASLREALAREPGNAELHHALADLEEKSGNVLEAAREYQRAAELDSSEANLFEWGSDLLKHRAFEQATDVMTKGVRLYPRSLRLRLGLASAWYARGVFDRAAARFFEACDLEPDNPEPYEFLGKVQSGEITQLEGYLERMRRFAERHPDNAWADYYYALALWREHSFDDLARVMRVRQLLDQAVRIDPQLGLAHLQLGIWYADLASYPRAIAALRKAIEVSPSLEEPHYRLGQLYERTGEKEKARRELRIYEEMSRKSAEVLERERREKLQFVFDKPAR